MSSTCNNTLVVSKTLPTEITELRDVYEVFSEQGIDCISSDYHELFDLPDQMLRWGPNAIFAFRYEDLKFLGTHPAVGNFPAEMFVRQGFTAMQGLPIPFEESGNILRFQKNQFFTTEPSVHAAVKRIFTHPFMPRDIPKFQDMATEIANKVVDAVSEIETINFVSDFAAIVSMKFWAEIFGMTAEEQTGLANAMHKLGTLTAGLDHTASGFKKMNDEGFPEYWKYLVPPIRRARENGNHMFLNKMATQFSALSTDLGDLPEDVDMFVACNLIDGFHALAGGISCTVYEMLRQPGTFDLIKADRTRASDLVAEALRLNPQVPLTSRYVWEDIAYNDLLIPKGSKVSLYWAAANRDPEQYAEPASFNISRSSTPAMTFGNGAQICPGRNVVQALTLATINVLVQDDVSIELAGKPVWLGSGFAPDTSIESIPVIIKRL